MPPILTRFVDTYACKLPMQQGSAIVLTHQRGL